MRRIYRLNAAAERGGETQHASEAEEEAGDLIARAVARWGGVAKAWKLETIRRKLAEVGA